PGNHEYYFGGVFHTCLYFFHPSSHSFLYNDPARICFYSISDLYVWIVVPVSASINGYQHTSGN
ncbi:hypothetical protein ACFL67_04335, partial [candidate division KSB1 bacterium]